MSKFTSSSSNGDEIPLGDIMFVCFKAFLKDFEFQDIKIPARSLFKNEDYTSILHERDEETSLIRLFLILRNNEEQLKAFLKTLEWDYNWLVKLVETEWATPSMDARLYWRALRAMRIKRHKHIDYNVSRIEPYMELRRALLQLRPHNYVLLCGELGSGKKWLAYDVCSDFVVLQSMDFKIFWLDLSPCTRPEEDLRKLRHLWEMLEMSTHPIVATDSVATAAAAAASTPICYRQQGDIAESIPNRILSVQLKIKNKLQTPEYENCLLVLENVPNKKAWDVFNLGGKTLILTRNTKLRDTLSPKLCRHIDLSSELTTAEFYQLFENYTKIDRSKFPPNCLALYESSEKKPYLLSLIAQNIKRRHNWDEWLDNLRNSNFNVNKFNAIIEISLKNLPTVYEELYRKLAVFHHSTTMPVQLVAHLWNTTVSAAEHKLEYLANFSMILKRSWDDNTTTYELPFIYSLYLKNCPIELHLTILDYYNLRQSFNGRLDGNHWDAYFYHCVGYHLKEARYFEWFAKFFLDFHFLERFVRKIGLLNTMGHFAVYESYITNGEKSRMQLLRAIKDFLPKIEDKLVYSQDTCLLQYALMEKGLVKEEALRQVRDFPHNVWLEDKGKFRHCRQIFQLESQARQVVLLEEELVLIVLHNNDIKLRDISLDYNKDPIFIGSDHRHDAKVIDVRLFDGNNFVLLLNDYGELTLLSIEDEQRRSIVRRRNSKKKVYAQNFRSHRHNAKPDTAMLKQRVNTVLRASARVVAFVLDAKQQLHVALDDGRVHQLDWNREKAEFERNASGSAPLNTGRLNIRVLALFGYRYCMVVTGQLEVSFWCLRDSSRVCSYGDWFARDDQFIGHELSTVNGAVHVVFVFRRKLWRLIVEHADCVALRQCQPELLYQMEDNNNEITCGRLTRNGKYIVLGTKHGLIVFDAFNKAEILRGNVSEDISCVDVYSLDDPVFKYIIVCGTEKKHALYINGLRLIEGTALAWAHDVTADNVEDERSYEPQLEPNVRLCGHKKFAVASGHKGCELLAADTKNRIHQVRLSDDRAWSLIDPEERLGPGTGISVLSCHNQHAFAGYENGDLYNISQLQFIRGFTRQPIVMLHVIDDDYLVASSETEMFVYNYQTGGRSAWANNCQYCVKVSPIHLVMIVDHCRGLLLNLRDHREHETIFDITPHGLRLGGCDFQNDCLYVAMQTHELHIFQICTKSNGNIWFNQIYSNTEQQQQAQEPQHFSAAIVADHLNKNGERTSKVSCVAVSKRGDLVAIGFDIGCIKLYKFSSCDSTLHEVYVMHSHESAINDMLFSPDGRVLISCGNQMCFWNVHHMLNNPLVRDVKRRGSTRFSSKHTSADIEETDSAVIGRRQYLSVGGAALSGSYDECVFKSCVSLVESRSATETRPPFDWQDKQGTARKPELYACIKFDGNHAERIIANPEFTEFRTIDDEGVYYNLTLLTGVGEQPPSADDTDSRMEQDRENYANGNGQVVYERHDDMVIVYD